MANQLLIDPNTGVPAGAQTLNAADQAPAQQTPIDVRAPLAPQAAPPPEHAANAIVGLLSTLSGLGINIAGAATNKVGAGDSVTQFGMNQLAGAAANNKAEDTYKKDSQASLALWPQAISVFKGNDKALRVARTLLEQGKYKEVESLMQHQQVLARQDTTDLNKDTRDTSAALGVSQASLKAQDKAIVGDPGFQAAQSTSTLGNFYAGRKDFFKSSEELRAAINQNPAAAGFKTKIDPKASTELFKEYKSSLETKEVPRTLFGHDIPFTGVLPEGSTPQNVLSGFVDQKLGKDNKAGFESLQGTLSDNGMKRDAIAKLQINLRSPSITVRRKAIDQASQFLAGGGDVQETLKNPGIPEADWAVIKKDPAKAKQLIQSLKK